MGYFNRPLCFKHQKEFKNFKDNSEPDIADMFSKIADTILNVYKIGGIGLLLLFVGVAIFIFSFMFESIDLYLKIISFASFIMGSVILIKKEINFRFIYKLIKYREKKNDIKELRKKIIPNIKARNLFNNPDKNLKGQKVYRALALIKKYDPESCGELELKINELIKWGRAGTRPQHVKNVAHDIVNFIILKTEEMDSYNVKSDREQEDDKSYFEKIKNIFLNKPLIAWGAIFFIVTVFVLGILNGVFDLTDRFINNKKKEPSLNFVSDNTYPPVSFEYYGLDYKKVEDKKMNDSVNLEELIRIEFIVYLQNDGDTNLIYNIKRGVIKESNNKFLFNDEPPDILKRDVFLPKGMKFMINMSGVVAEYLLSELEKDQSFNLTFQPEIGYHSEGQEEM
ncbi:MAG: hypothetical protein AB1472_07300, partial [Candidatus Omnitrophota bacterium]